MSMILKIHFQYCHDSWHVKHNFHSVKLDFLLSFDCFQFKYNLLKVTYFLSLILHLFDYYHHPWHGNFSFELHGCFFACCAFVLGYDSDDEYEDKPKSRWSKGRAYKSLPTNREEEEEEQAQQGVRDPSRSYPGLTYNRYASPSGASSRQAGGVRQGSPVEPYSDTVRTSDSQRPQRASPVNNSSLNTSQDTDDDYEILPTEKPGTYTRHPQEGGMVTSLTLSLHWCWLLLSLCDLSALVRLPLLQLD